MKHIFTITAVLALVLVWGMNFADAQQMPPGGCEMMQDCPMARGGDMMGPENPPCHMGTMSRMDRMEHMMPDNMMEARHHIMRMLKALGLDEKQKESIHTLINKTMKDMIKKRSDLLIAEMDLEDALHKDMVDMSAAESKLKQIEAMRTDMFMTHLKAFQEVKSMLTPEQRSKLKEMMERRMMGGMGMMRGSGCGMMERRMAPHNEKMMMK